MKKILTLGSTILLIAFMANTAWSETEAGKTVEPVSEAAAEAPADAATDKATEPMAEAAADTPSDKATEEEGVKADDAAAKVTASAEGAKVYIVSPADGDEVTSPVKVVFGLSGMGVAPAGVDKENTGHHHLLIDKEELPAEGVPMGSDVQHFGGGQTEAEVELEAGQHTLQLILGDMLHIPHSPVVSSEKITITVK